MPAAKLEIIPRSVAEAAVADLWPSGAMPVAHRDIEITYGTWKFTVRVRAVGTRDGKAWRWAVQNPVVDDQEWKP